MVIRVHSHYRNSNTIHLNNQKKKKTRHCSDDIRDSTNTVVDAPTAVSEPALASAPAGGSLSVSPTGAAEAVARSSRARGLREVSQTEDSDGDGGAEGGENLSNRSCSAPCEGGGGLSNSSGSASARCTLDLSDSDGADIDSDDDVIASGEPMDGVPRSVGTGSEDESEEDEGPGASFRRSTRIRRPNVRLREYMLDIPASLVIQSVNELLEPTSVKKALAAPDAKEWIKALDTEYQELMRNHVWELVERPKGVKVLKNKWVFVRKRNAKGEVCRYRTRITIKGCQQQFGVNFWETLLLRPNQFGSSYCLLCTWACCVAKLTS
jgi:hypothetical protein